ncbi:MAG: hypothetical protein WC389_00075 [Lutibacter sp.]|jgi:hypothetical protein
MKNLKNVKFIAKDWSNNEPIIGNLSVRCKKTLKTFDELKVTREDGTSFDTNHHGYIIGIETEGGFVMVNPETIFLPEKVTSATNKVTIGFVNWLMENCELAEDNSLWSYNGEDYTNKKLFKIYKNEIKAEVDNKKEGFELIEILLNEFHNDLAKNIIDMKIYKPLSSDLLIIKEKIHLLK